MLVQLPLSMQTVAFLLDAATGLEARIRQLRLELGRAPPAEERDRLDLAILESELLLEFILLCVAVAQAGPEGEAAVRRLE